LSEAQSRQLLALLQDKDRDAVRQLAQVWQLDSIWLNAFAALPELYGSREVLDKARTQLPQLTAITQALDTLAQVCAAFPEQAVHIDLAEVRVDNYHTGLLYAAYTPDYHDAVARGGRYDGLGAYFGRSRPATGFSFDLRLFGAYLAASERPAAVRVAQKDYAAAQKAVDELRAQGVCVVVDYGLPDNSGSLKTLVQHDNEWKVA